MQSSPLHIDQRIHHELARSVIGNLSATIHVHYRNVSGSKDVFASSIQAEREDRRMLQKPDLVRRRSIAFFGEALHVAPGGYVLHLPEPLKDWFGCLDGDGVDYGCHVQPGAADETSSPALLRSRARSAR